MDISVQISGLQIVCAQIVSMVRVLSTLLFAGAVAQEMSFMTEEMHLAAEADACLVQVNKYRATKGVAAISLKSSSMSCAQQSASNAAKNGWHQSFGRSSEGAQCEAKGTLSCAASITMYYNEGPGNGIEHGHYNIIMDGQYKNRAYGSAGSFWAPNCYRSTLANATADVSI